MEKYIAYRDINEQFICGQVKCTRGTVFYVDDKDYIIAPSTRVRLCLKKSEHAYQSFIYDTDDRGLQRYDLLKNIYDKIGNFSINKKGSLFEILEKDGIAKKYKKDSNEDEWVWDRFNLSCAHIFDLEHINRIVNNVSDAR